MNLTRVAQQMARKILPSILLVRHASDEEERRLDLQAAERANRAVDEWQAATTMQRALIWERHFWERHGQHEDG